LPLVSIALVLANVVVYVLAIVHGGSVLSGPSRTVALHYGAIPAKLGLTAVFSSSTAACCNCSPTRSRSRCSASTSRTRPGACASSRSTCSARFSRSR
jgi:hypothetical protein